MRKTDDLPSVFSYEDLLIDWVGAGVKALNGDSGSGKSAFVSALADDLAARLITTAVGSVTSILDRRHVQNGATFSDALITTARGWSYSGSAPRQVQNRPALAAETLTRESISNPGYDPEMVKMLDTCGRRHEEIGLERPTNAEIRRRARIDKTTFSKLLTGKIEKRTKKGYFTAPYERLFRVCMHDEPTAPDRNKQKRAARKEV